MEVPEDKQAFVARFGGVFEHSPWVAERTWHRRPFASAEALHRAMMQRRSQRAARRDQLALIRAHPELAGREAKEGALTADSSSEQGRLGFTALDREEFAEMARLNRALPREVRLSLYRRAAPARHPRERDGRNGAPPRQ